MNQKTTVRDSLAHACQAHRTEWLLNGSRWRHALSMETHSLMPSGTTSNEALHAELNHIFRRVQSMHSETLDNRLKVIKLAKLLTHNVAFYRATTRQER